MGQHFKLTNQEFNDSNVMFGILEIKAEQVVGKNYQELSKLLKKQYSKLILVNHPDKGGNAERFRKIHEAYNTFKEYIKPLESGNHCVEVSVDAESYGHLTASEFYYRKKLFEKFKITEEEVTGKGFKELFSILKNKDNSFTQDYEYRQKLIKDIHSNSTGMLATFLLDETEKLREKLKKHLLKPNMSLLEYIIPLQNKQNLITEDKRALAQRFIERKNGLLSSVFKTKMYILLPLAWVEAVYCYSFWPTWLIASNTLTYLFLPLIILNLIMIRILPELEKHYTEKYTNSQISTDEYISKMGYVHLCYKLFVFYPLPIVFSYLLVEGIVSNSFNVDIVIFGTISLLALLITEVLSPTFSKGCEIYAEKHTKDLLEEDSRDRVQKETDLLKWYDPHKLLMPIFMPLVKKCFGEVASELAERNLDNVNTDMSDVKPEQPKAIEFTPQNIPV